MTIALPPDVVEAINVRAQQLGTSVEVLAISALREKFRRVLPPIDPRDDWERRLLAIGSDCGVSLSDEALSSEGLYD